MDCTEARFYLALRRPAGDELGPDAAAALDAHLAGCPGCAAAGRALGGFDAKVSRAVAAVPVPGGLRDRLVAAVGVRAAAARRRRVAGGLALAASVALLVGLGLGAFSAARPRPDAASLVDAAERRWEAPDEAARAWLAEQGLPVHLPLAFDYRQLVSMGTEKVQGRTVPVMVFVPRTGAGFAKVYIFKGSAFDLKGLQGADASNVKAVAVPGDEVGYLILHTGDDLKPFQRPDGGQFTRAAAADMRGVPVGS